MRNGNLHVQLECIGASFCTLPHLAPCRIPRMARLVLFISPTTSFQQQDLLSHRRLADQQIACIRRRSADISILLTLWQPADQQTTTIHSVSPVVNASFCGALPLCGIHAPATRSSSRRATQYAPGDSPIPRFLYWRLAKLYTVHFGNPPTQHKEILPSSWRHADCSAGSHGVPPTHITAPRRRSQ